jgi:hypothetical protein
MPANTRQEKDCCCSGLIVKSSIIPTCPMLSISRASRRKETPRPSLPSWTTAVKEQECEDYGRKVASINVGRISLDDIPSSLRSDDISVSRAAVALES